MSDPLTAFPIATRRVTATGDSLMRAADTKAVRSLISLEEVVDTNIQMPSFDGIQDNIHIDVVRDDDGIFGYKYWATYTGMKSNREHPQVAASQDGLSWELPFGCKNPLVTRYADIPTLGQSPSVLGDSDMVWDGTTLYVFFITSWMTSGGGNAFYMTKTTDGKTWSTPQLCFTHTHNSNGSAASPAVVDEGGGNLRMYYMLYTAGASQYRVNVRTSTDSGATWSEPTECTVPVAADPVLWHIDVVKVGTTYHALILYSYGSAQSPQGNTGTPVHYTSSDGATFGGASIGPPALPWINRELMQSCYRGSLVPNTDYPGTFDVFIPAFNNYVKAASTWSQILIHRFRRMELLDGTEFRVPVDAHRESSVRYLSPRRAVVLDQDFEFTTLDAAYATLASRSANPWGRPNFTVPIRDGETLRIRATLYVLNTLAGEPATDNYRVTVRPHGAAATAGMFRLKVTKASGTTAITPKEYVMQPPAEGLGLRTAAGGGGAHMIEVDGFFTYAPGDDSTSFIGVRVYPQSDPATYGSVTILKGSSLQVDRIGQYESLPAEIGPS